MLNLDQESAVMHLSAEKSLRAGSKEFCELLEKEGLSKLSVELEGDWEMKLFTLRKTHRNEWIARRRWNSVSIGKSDEITYGRLAEVDRHFGVLEKRRKPKSETS